MKSAAPVRNRYIWEVSAEQTNDDGCVKLLLYVMRSSSAVGIEMLLINPLTALMTVCLQGHVFAMEISSGDEFYIACDNTGTPLAVFSNNGLLLKQVPVFPPKQKESSQACNLFS